MPHFFKKLRDYVSGGTKRLGYIQSSIQDEKLNWGGEEFLTAHQIALYLNRAINKRAEKVGEVEFVLRDQKEQDIENDPLVARLYKPNTYMTGAEFWGLFQTYKDLTGAAYIWKETSERFNDQVPAALHLLRPDWTKPIVKDAAIVGFEYRKPNGKTITFAPDEIFYSYYPDPLNMFFGLPLVKAGARAVDTEVQVAQYHSSVLRNGGKVEGVFKFKTDRLSRDQLGELKDDYKKEYATAKKAGLPLFMGGDSDYSRLGLTPEELGYMEAKKMSLEDVCILTGVPRSILASFDDVKFDNADAALTVFLSETINPLLKNLTQKLDEFMFPGPNTLTYIDPTPANVDRNLKIAESGVRNYYLTRNEARELAGYDALPDGDVILVPFSLIPSESVEDLAAAREENTNPAEVPPAKSKAEFVHPLRDKFVRERYGKLKGIRMTRMEKNFAKATKQFFKAQLKRIEQSLPTEKSALRKKSLLSEVFDMTTEIALTRTFAIPLIRALLDEGGNDAMAMAGSEQQYTLSPDMEAWLDERADVLGKQMTDTTYTELKAAFETSADQNENRDALIGRIRTVYAGYSEARAALIARTEVHGAYQNGSFDGYKKAGVPTKIWVAVGDGETRDAHLMADGQEVPIDQPFDVGGESLQYPGDSRASAGNTINCRCTI